jgi:hypothetical protein
VSDGAGKTLGIDMWLPLFVIYQRPSDYPNSFVVRVFDLYNAARAAAREGKTVVFEGSFLLPPQFVVYPSLEIARTALPPGLTRLPRDPSDEPHIVESWI